MAVDPEEYAETSMRLRGLLIRQAAARGSDFPAALRYAGRDLPKPVRLAGARIVELGMRLENPKLAQVSDAEALAQDVAVVERHLNRLNPATRKARKRANFAAGLALQIIVVIVALIAVLRWRGLI